jgi:hypothetical protein
MSSAAQKQARLFKGQQGSAGAQDSSAPARPGTNVNSLNINIPKPPNMVSSVPPGPNPPPKLGKQVQDSTTPKDDADRVAATPADGRSYRERLVEKLGHKYNGVEKYRLEQDEARSRHWKKWGPYLSERQWVCRRRRRLISRRRARRANQ